MNKLFGERRFWNVIFITSALIICSIYVSVTNGTFDLSALDVLRTLLRINPTSEHDLVVFDFRLPRIIIGALVGFGLGISGAVLQGITKNALADSGILGIQAAAGTSVVLGMFLLHGTIKGPSWLTVMSMPMLGWLGGIAAVVFLYMFAKHKGEFDPQRLILVGIALGSGFGALTIYISLKMNPQDFETATVWLAGSVYNANWKNVVTTLPWLVILVPIIWRKAYILDLMQIGELSVRGLGVQVQKERKILLLCCVGLVSACVAVSGSIGFVGLIAPHIARRLVGIHYRYIVPVCGLIGMLMVIVGDLIGKTIFAPSQLPVGIVISIIGVPYFLYQMYRAKKR